MGVTIIATLLNEEKSLPDFLDSILAQTRPPDEVVLVDGGSKDRSCEIIQEYAARDDRIKLIRKEGANRSQGRNEAIRQASHDIIAATDVGCKLDSDWLKQIVVPLEAGAADVASGYYRPEANTFFEQAVAATTVLDAKEVDEKNFLPSSRSVAFTREIWERVGGYPEYNTGSEDTLFDIHLQAMDARFQFVPEALVYWKQQGSIKGLFKQFFYYARSDAMCGVMQRHYRKVFFLVGLLLGLILITLGSLVVLPQITPWLAGMILFILLAYSGRYIIRAKRRGYDWQVALISPLIMSIVDLANYIGFKGRPLYQLEKTPMTAHNKAD